MKTNIQLWLFLAQFFEWEIFQTKAVGRMKYILSMFSNIVLLKNRAVYEIMWNNMV
jgi:hypothetical protein